jgi:hypothetical protein
MQAYQVWFWNPIAPLCSALGLAAWLACSSIALAEAEGEAEGVTIEKVEFAGWRNNLRIANGEAELIATLDVGPRIIGYRLAGGKNVFKEYTEQLGRSGENDWMIRGGHRLWAAPEDVARTYALDNGPVKWRELNSGFVRLTPAAEAEFGLQKEIDIKLEPRGSAVTVIHRIQNIAKKPTELAPWALTVMAPGGTEIIPLPPMRPHPGSAKNAQSADDFAPNQLLRLWPYTDMKDPRWSFGTKYITLRQDASRGPTKLGLAHRMGWVGYLNGGTLFVKRFAYREDKQPYPDQGCNFETFTNQDMLEIESLGPLVRLAPDESIELQEQWELIPNLSEVTGEESIDAKVLPRVKRP